LANEPPTPSRRLGDYYRSGDWSDYWRTAVSETSQGILRIRGYPIQEIIRHLSYAEALFLTIKGELPTKAQARVLDAAIMALLDHQFVSSHAPAARFVASAHSESPVPGIAAGILCAGMHTISPNDAALLLAEAWERMHREKLSQEETARRVVEEHRREGKYIPGFGHPTHKEFDPRGEALMAVAKEQGVWGERARLYEAIHQEFVRSSGKRLPINIDGVLACVLTELGFEPVEMVGVAVTAILPGIIAHVVEEIRDGVPLRIVPDALGSRYVGHPERHIPPRRGSTPSP